METKCPFCDADRVIRRDNREVFEKFVKIAGFTDWSRYGEGYAKPLIDRLWSAWSTVTNGERT